MFCAVEQKEKSFVRRRESVAFACVGAHTRDLPIMDNVAHSGELRAVAVIQPEWLVNGGC